jgi:hypothetical protein
MTEWPEEIRQVRSVAVDPTPGASVSRTRIRHAGWPITAIAAAGMRRGHIGRRRKSTGGRHP